MNKEDLKKIAIDAAMERVVGSSSVPVKYLKKLIDEMSVMLDEYKAAKTSVEKYESLTTRFLREIERIEKMQRGEQGAPGRDGRDGRDGKDAEEVDLRALARAAAALVRTPQDGKDAIVDYNKIRKDVVRDIVQNKRLKTSDIEGLRNEIDSYRNQLAGKHYGKDTWARGGGDTVAAGTNVTITVDENGNKVISAQGGSGGAQIATETVTATDAGGNNVDIDLTQLSNPWSTIEMVIRNGVIQNQSKWSITGDTLTLIGAVATNDFQLQYTYA